MDYIWGGVWWVIYSILMWAFIATKSLDTEAHVFFYRNALNYAIEFVYIFSRKDPSHRKMFVVHGPLAWKMA